MCGSSNIIFYVFTYFKNGTTQNKKVINNFFVRLCVATFFVCKSQLHMDCSGTRSHYVFFLSRHTLNWPNTSINIKCSNFFQSSWFSRSFAVALYMAQFLDCVYVCLHDELICVVHLFCHRHIVVSFSVSSVALFAILFFGAAFYFIFSLFWLLISSVRPIFVCVNLLFDTTNKTCIKEVELVQKIQIGFGFLLDKNTIFTCG